ncbi:MAG: amino acid adenylation domain-containing protein, partial [Pyrinomonadaceae bacterium]
MSKFLQRLAALSPEKRATLISRLPPLSFSQQRLWFIDQLEPGGSFYNLASAFRFRGRLDVAILERTLNEIMRRHKALKTSFVSVGGQPVQIIDESVTLSLPVTDLSYLTEAEREAEAARLATEEARRPFDLSEAPLMRAQLLRLSEEEHVALFTMHHIVSDGWSMGVLVKEVAALYEAYSRGEESPLPELPIQYADYAVWQRQRLQGEVLDAQMSYWRGQLGGELPILNLPTDRPRPAVQSHRGAHEVVKLPVELAEALKELSRREGATLYMTMLAAFQLLLSCYARQQDVLVGSPIAGRSRAETEGLIGLFINTLIMRTDLSGEPTFRELLSRVKEVSLGAYAHQDVPFEKLVEELQPKRSMSHSPLFQAMFVLQNAPMSSLSMPRLTLEPFKLPGESARYELGLTLTEGPEGLTGTLEYMSDLFDAQTVKRMVGHLHTLLSAVVANPDCRISDFTLLTASEQESLRVWNQTPREYEGEPCLHQLFEAQVARTPDAGALTSEGVTLSYAELNARANQLARQLRDSGVRRGAVVGILMERSVEMVVALYATLKAGAAYLPLDPAYPTQRLSFMVEDAGARVILAQQHLTERVSGCDTRVLCPDSERDVIARQSADNPRVEVSSEDLAYVIYTSGSTGQPKGVTIPHSGIRNRIFWMQEEYQIGADDRVLQKTPYSFDVSVWEFFWPLLFGARLVMARPEGHKDSEYLVEVIKEQRITILHFVPSMLQVFLQTKDVEQCTSLKKVMCSGEALSYELQEQFFARLGAELHNLYGPTEASVDVTFWACAPNERRVVPIGRPIANTQIHLLDERLEPVPVGVPAELFIGGDGLASGYLRRPALTATRFIPDPFSSEPGARLYRTGDLARRLPSGEVEYLGRIDNQVKVRGFRIELGEIESALAEHPAVRECVVIARGGQGAERSLAAYVVAAEGVAPQASELRSHLLSRLPEYMAPAAYVMLDSLPLSPNGKVDHKALPEPEMSASDADDDGPRTLVEELLCGVWAGLLKVGRVRPTDNFFELGGHSLLATQLVSRVREACGVELPLRALFESPTVEGMAAQVEARLRGEEGSVPPPVVRVERGESAPLSFAQQRLWFIDRLEGGSAFYNSPAAVRLSGALEVEALRRTLCEIVRRHEALRTRFVEAGGEPRQVVEPASGIALPVTDLSHLAEAEREAEATRLAGEEARLPFDLSRGPLLRAQLLRLGEEEHVALLTMHHIVSDGWSMG